jgi:hypothetical protein
VTEIVGVTEMVGVADLDTEVDDDVETDGVLEMDPVAVAVDVGCACEKSTVRLDMIPGFAALVENVLVPPTAYTTHVVDDDVLICASPALPLFAFRFHLAVVTPPDTLQLTGVVPDDG